MHPQLLLAATKKGTGTSHRGMQPCFNTLPAYSHLGALLQDITKNFTAAQAAAELGQLLKLPWSNATLVTLTENVTVQVSRKGKALVQVTPAKPQQRAQPSASTSSSSSTPAGSTQASQQQQQGVAELFSSTAQLPPLQQTQQPLISLQHDRVKVTPINGSVADPFLYKIGLQTAEGRIKANMQVSVSGPLMVPTAKLRGCMNAGAVNPAVWVC